MERKWFLVLMVGTLLGMTLLSGCAAGVSQEDFAKVQSDLAATKTSLAAAQDQIKTLSAAQQDLAKLKAEVASLSAISAYHVWYDQYYGVNNYIFYDVASFNAKLGALVYATGDSTSKAAWDAYLVTDKALNDVLAQLPEDYTTWMQEQTNKWSEANTPRYNALGEVGTALFKVTNFEATQLSILQLEAQVASLSAISAYNIWYDQYYNFGTEKQFYAFTDTASFNKRLGDLVDATGDSASKAAWDTYLVADKALSDVLAQLPEDYKTWTQEQTNKWSEANTPRYNALGEVGTALLNAIASS